MIVRDLLLLVVCLCGISVVPSRAVEPPIQEGLPAFVNGAVTELVSSPLQVSQFKSAQIETIEDLGAAGGIGRYLCWLKNDQGRVGYMAVAVTSNGFAVMAFSATTVPPNYFLEHLTVFKLPVQSLDLSQATEMSFIEKLPLVASTETMLGAESIQISELASSLVGLFQSYCQMLWMKKFSRSGWRRGLAFDPGRLPCWREVGGSRMCHGPRPGVSPYLASVGGCLKEPVPSPKAIPLPFLMTS